MCRPVASLPKWSTSVLLLAALSGCSATSRTQAEPTPERSSPTPADAAPTDAASTQPRDDSDIGRCYPYLPTERGDCPTRCRSIDDCAGSRGPVDFAENGWPLDCINEKCVPLPPEAVTFD